MGLGSSVRPSGTVFRTLSAIRTPPKLLSGVRYTDFFCSQCILTHPAHLWGEGSACWCAMWIDTLLTRLRCTLYYRKFHFYRETFLCPTYVVYVHVLYSCEHSDIFGLVTAVFYLAHGFRDFMKPCERDNYSNWDWVERRGDGRFRSVVMWLGGGRCGWCSLACHSFVQTTQQTYSQAWKNMSVNKRKNECSLCSVFRDTQSVRL